MGPDQVAALEAALSLWSIAVQSGVAAILVVVFFTAWFATRRRVTASWTIAWLMDVVGLCAVFCIASLGSSLDPVLILGFYATYGAGKILFALFLILGLYQYRRFRLATSGNVGRWMFLFAALWGMLLFLLFDSPVHLQTTVYLTFGILLCTAGGQTLFTTSRTGAQLLSVILLVHGGLFLHHGIVLIPSYWGGDIPSYMSHVSFIDAVAEFMVGLGCVMAVGWSIIEEISGANQKLEKAHQTLRTLVDSDPLTGLSNRRRLRPFVSGMQEKQGVVLFLDVDHFKMINDGWGHTTGDECLCRIATCLRNTFRPEDGLFRIGGDEFLVLIPGMSESSVRKRVTVLREALVMPDSHGIPLSVSVGFATFNEQVSLETALKSADAAMYREKSGREAGSEGVNLKRQ